MAENSKIQWTDHTFNPWVGCAKVSPGCLHCYAENLMDTRHHRVKWGKGQPRSRTSPANWALPVKWNRDAKAAQDHWDDAIANHAGDVEYMSGIALPARPRVFCASLADWLDEEVPVEWLADLLQLIYECQNLDWLLLTKRPDNWATRVFAAALYLAGYRDGQTSENPTAKAMSAWEWVHDWISTATAPTNVWLGTSVEDQTRANERIPELLSIPARVRFLSMEPLLGPVDLTKVSPKYGDIVDALRGYAFHDVIDHVKQPGEIDWVIIGGESGPGAREFSVDHAADLVQQCEDAGVPSFVKQLGAFAVTSNANLHDWPAFAMLVAHGTEAAGARVITSDKKGGDMTEWPEFLQVRQFPVVS